MDRFNTAPSGYRFDKLIFFGFVFLLIVGFVYLLRHYGTNDQPYLNCDKDNCINPFSLYTPICPGFYCPPVNCTAEWCKMDFLPRGEYGTPPPFLVKNFGQIAFSMLIFLIILNHFLYNRKVKFSIPTKRKILPSFMAYFVKLIYPNFKNTVDFKTIYAKMKEEEEEEKEKLKND